ncbi:hypothetical protein AMTR_s00065p00133740 [Amborella trichopoda]|uniref:Uncharacterized protein n=1 Tax=Amborella trichopoda TaxID=13333 RepID=U5D8Q8_AMBTC|nr:hypothetical protein AMTR_s00065p00133740 [Amborella trichopoda]
MTKMSTKKTSMGGSMGHGGSSGLGHEPRHMVVARGADHACDEWDVVATMGLAMHSDTWLYLEDRPHVCEGPCVRAQTARTVQTDGKKLRALQSWTLGVKWWNAVEKA